jgi:hypothetical protein
MPINELKAKDGPQIPIKPVIVETLNDVVCLLLRGNHNGIHLYGEGAEVASLKKNGGLNGRVVFHESLTGLLKTAL